MKAFGVTFLAHMEKFKERDSLPKRIVILADIHPGTQEEWGFQEWESSESVQHLAEVCRKVSGARVDLFTNLYEFFACILDFLNSEGLIVWNLMEGLYSRNREGYVPALAESLGICCLGSDAYSQILTLDKYLFKKALPSELSGKFGMGILDLPTHFPIFVKPRWEGSSMGIDSCNRIVSESDRNSFGLKILENQCLSSLHPGRDWIWEEYLPGEEYTVCLLETETGWIGEAAVVKSPESVYSESVKTKSAMPEKILPVKSFLKKEWILHNSVKLAEEWEWEGYARLDWKENAAKEPIILEANLTPGLSAFYSLYPLVWKELGNIEYEDLIFRILHKGWRNFREKKRYYYGKKYQNRLYSKA